MKLFVATLCVLVGMAFAEVTWSEDGQYRLVDDDTSQYQYIYDGAPVPASYLQFYQMPSEEWKWSEDGQYRLVGDDPEQYRYVPIDLNRDVDLSYKIFPMPAELKWSEDGQYKMVVEDPKYEYVYPMPYRSFANLWQPRAPFSYSYKQISSKK